MQHLAAGLDEQSLRIVLIEHPALMALTFLRLSIRRFDLCCHHLLIAFATWGERYLAVTLNPIHVYTMAVGLPQAGTARYRSERATTAQPIRASLLASATTALL